MSRSLGWTLLTTRSPIEIVPEVIFSSPASIRNKVDLPQPEGPTSTTKAPSSIGIVTPCRTSKPPNDLRTSRICTDDINFLPNLLAWCRLFDIPAAQMAHSNQKRQIKAALGSLVC